MRPHPAGLPKVIVTGAEEHQGLAVIRGLGLKGIPVVACGSQQASLGFYSRFAIERFAYTSPFQDPERFVTDILDAADRSHATLIIPSVESTLVVLDAHRASVEERCRLAAPSSPSLAVAVDKLETLALAERLGVPTPRTVYDDSAERILQRAGELLFPVAIKPRGHALSAKTKNSLGFKVKYARTFEHLASLIRSVEGNGSYPLIQEYAPGIGVCVSAVFDRGRPVVLFPYLRVREVPLSGGISVLRRSLPLDERLAKYVELLLGALEWHGVAMVEFRYNAGTDSYTLMEINGRFQASTALSLDAGLNLPYLVYSLFTDGRLNGPYTYRTGIEERWLRGDLFSLLGALLGDTRQTAVPDLERRLPSRGKLLRDFLYDFRPGMHYDEFKLYDLGPALAECKQLALGAIEFLKGWSRPGPMPFARGLSKILRLIGSIMPWASVGARR